MDKTLTTIKTAWLNITQYAQWLNPLQSAALLISRIYVAEIFFASGLTKIRDWGSTVELFTYEYKVPVLSPTLAAVLGTAGELVLPVLLVLGVTGRFAALGLFMVNAVAVVALQDIAPAALQQHVFWGWLLAFLAVMGVGKWSIDHVLKQRLNARTQTVV